jgi:hypothetical protein
VNKLVQLSAHLELEQDVEGLGIFICVEELAHQWVLATLDLQQQQQQQ